VGCEGAVVGWFCVDVISGLLVNRDEEGNVRAATGVALAEVVLVLFRFRFNGRDDTFSIFSVVSGCTCPVRPSSMVVLAGRAGCEASAVAGTKLTPLTAF